MNNSKKKFALLLAVIMALCAIPFAAMAGGAGGEGAADPLSTKDEQLDLALNIEGGALSFTTGGEYPWTAVELEDRNAAVSTCQGVNNGSSSVTTTMTTQEGQTIEFEWSVSSEANYDKALFIVDGQTAAILSSPSNGVLADWREHIYVPTPGEHVFEWKYVKDSGDDYGEDCAWLDNVRIGEIRPVTGVSVEPAEATVYINETLQLSALIEPEDASVKNYTWSSSDEGVATVSDAGLVTGVSTGTAVITATTQEGGFTAHCSVTVPEPIDVTGISFNAESGILAVGSKGTLIAAVEPSNATDKSMSWQSDDEDVATVDQNGLVTAVSVGETQISAVTNDGNFIASCAVTVVNPIDLPNEAGITYREAEFGESAGLTLGWNESEQIRYSRNGVAYTITWAVGFMVELEPLHIYSFETASDASGKLIDTYISLYDSDFNLIDSNDDNGSRFSKIDYTALEGGVYYLLVTGYSANETGSLTFTASDLPVVHVEGITLSETSLTLAENFEARLECAFTPENADIRDIVWTSSDEGVATVENGAVSAISAGTAVITAAAVDGGFKAECAVTVTPAEYCTITFVDGLNNEIIEEQAVQIGKDAVAPEPPEHDGYKFSGWDRAFTSVQGDMTVTALYSDTGSYFQGGTTIIGYTRNIFGEDGSYVPYNAWVMFDTKNPAGTLTELSRAGVKFFSAAFDGEAIYGLDIDYNFYSVDTETFETTLIGSCNQRIEALTYDWESDKIYGIASDNKLCEVDRATGRATQVASWNTNSYQFILPIAYVGNGEFITVDFLTRNIFKLELDGNATAIGRLNDPNAWVPSATYNRQDGLVYLTYTSLTGSSLGTCSNLYSVNPQTGEVVDLGYIGEEKGYYALGTFFADFANPEPSVPDNTTILGYTRNHFTDDGSYVPYPAWVKFSTLDPSNTLTELSRAGVEFFSAAYDGETIYGLDNDYNFYSVDTETFETTLIGSCNQRIEALTYDWESDKIYGLAGDNKLCEVDRATGRATQVASWNTNDYVFILPIAYIGNGEFFTVDFLTRNIVKLDLDGNATAIGRFEDRNAWVPSATYNREDGLVYLTYSSLSGSSLGIYGKLYTVDPQTGEINDLGFIGDELGYFVLGTFFADFANGSGDKPSESLDEALNLEPGLLQFETGGDYPWEVVRFQDVLCATSTNVAKNSTVSQISTTHYLNEGEMIRFDWRVSCHPGMAHLAFYVNGEEVSRYENDAELQLMPWDEYVYFAPESGEYTFTWSYEKTGFWSQGHDCGWLANVYAGEAIPVESVELDRHEANIRVGSGTKLNWVINPVYAYDDGVTLTSSDTSVASVDQDGNVRGVSVGEAVITITTHDGGFMDECAVTVSEGLPDTRLYAFRTWAASGMQDDMVSFYANNPSELESLYTPGQGTYAMAYAYGTIYGFTATGDYFMTTLDDTQWYYNGYNCGAQIMSMAYNYATGRMYAVGFREQGRWMLYEVNMGSGELREVGKPNTEDIIWIFDITTEGEAYGITANSGLLYRLDLETAQAELIGPTGCEEVNYGQSLTYDHDNQIMLWASYCDVNGLQEVNLETGEATYFSPIGHDAQITGMFMVPSNPPPPPGDVSVTGVTLDRNETLMIVGSSTKLAAAVLPFNATNRAVSWKSSNESVASVDSNGVVSAVAPGAAQITVTTVDGGFTDTCDVTVTTVVEGGVYVRTNEIIPGKQYVIASEYNGQLMMMSDVYDRQSSIRLVGDAAQLGEYGGQEAIINAQMKHNWVFSKNTAGTIMSLNNSQYCEIVQVNGYSWLGLTQSPRNNWIWDGEGNMRTDSSETGIWDHLSYVESIEGQAPAFDIWPATNPTYNEIRLYVLVETEQTQYTVTFVDGLTGETIEEQPVLAGEDAVAPEPPVHEGYDFAGWDGVFTNVQSNLTITARYLEIGATPTPEQPTPTPEQPTPTPEQPTPTPEQPTPTPEQPTPTPGQPTPTPGQPTPTPEDPPKAGGISLTVLGAVSAAAGTAGFIARRKRR